jgi:alpha-D-xyloside xylohydrolase
MFGPAFLVHPVTRAMYHLSDPPMATIPAEVLRTPDGQPGLAVQYFAGVDFDRPAGKTVDTNLEHAWPGPPLANPPPGLDGFDNFSARWEGTLTAPEDGEYEFGVDYDDGARLHLDSKLLVDDWSYGAKRFRSAKIALTRGQKVAVNAEFHQGGQSRYFRLGWRTPSALHALANRPKTLDNSMETYLPTGADWYDFRTGERFAGGRTVTKNCPIDSFPLYVRAGSIVPMGPPDLQYATERPAAPYEIRIYPGANATFTIYEDDNETYAYERGERATYDLVWNDAARTLNIGARQGSFPGLVAERELNISVVGGSDHASRTIRYAGAPIVVRLAP